MDRQPPLSDDRDKPGENVMKRPLTVLALAGTLAIATIATPTSAHAYWRGWGWGLGGLALGLTIAALARPAYAYYPAYSYGYGYPAYGYGYGGYYRPYYRSAYYYGGYRPAFYGGYRSYYYGGYRPAFYGGYPVARRVAIHRARWYWLKSLRFAPTTRSARRRRRSSGMDRLRAAGAAPPVRSVRDSELLAHLAARSGHRSIRSQMLCVTARSISAASRRLIGANSTLTTLLWTELRPTSAPRV